MTLIDRRPAEERQREAAGHPSPRPINVWIRRFSFATGCFAVVMGFVTGAWWILGPVALLQFGLALVGPSDWTMARVKAAERRKALGEGD
jgi:hypothetical protein